MKTSYYRRHKFIFIAFLSSTILFVYSCQSNHSYDNQLLGSWSLKEVNWVSTDTTYHLKKPQLGMLLITSESYSIMWSPTEEERTPFKALSNPTDDEIKLGFQSIVFNAGSYTSTDSTITTTAILAKVPGFEGGKQFYTFTLKDAFLTLTMNDETYPNGEKPNWSGVWQTRFTLEKVKLK